jgi:vacuolar-type H+-ATPase subunit E/Vma4
VALDELLRELTRRAESEIAVLRQRAHATADAIRAEAEARRAARVAAAIEAHTRIAGAAAERTVADAVRAGRLEELTARVRARDRVFAAVRARFEETSRGGAYAAVLPGRLTGAIGAVGEESAEIRCAPYLVGPLTTLVGDRPTLRVVSDARIVAGFRLVTVDHRVEVDETLDGRLTSTAAELSLVAMGAFQGDP